MAFCSTCEFTLSTCEFTPTQCEFTGTKKKLDLLKIVKFSKKKNLWKANIFFFSTCDFKSTKVSNSKKFNISEKKPPIKKITSVLKPTNKR